MHTDRCWGKLYAKENLHLQGECSLIIYNCCYDFEETWAKPLQKAIFSMDSVEFNVQLAQFAVNAI